MVRKSESFGLLDSVVDGMKRARGELIPILSSSSRRRNRFLVLHPTLTVTTMSVTKTPTSSLTGTSTNRLLLFHLTTVTVVQQSNYFSINFGTEPKPKSSRFSMEIPWRRPLHVHPQPPHFPMKSWK